MSGAVSRAAEAGKETPPPTGHVSNHALGWGNVYTLAAPVHRYPEARPAPLLKLSRIANYYTAVAGDRGYNGVLTRNPLPEPDLFTTTAWLREAPFSLEELADWIPKGWRSPPPPSIGRNVTMFRALSMRRAVECSHQTVSRVLSEGGP